MGQVWYMIVSFPDLCHLSYLGQNSPRSEEQFDCGLFVCFVQQIIY